MSFRNLSPQRMFEQMALKNVPRYRFAGKTAKDFAAWKRAAMPKVLATLGEFPDRVPPRPRFIAEWEHDGLSKQRWLIDVGPGIAATVLINRPAGMARGERRPAILCSHGHGAYGKEPVMGNDTSPDLRSSIETHRYNYGHVMAKAGFVTYSLDWIGFGERNDNAKPNFLNHNGGRDWCNLYYLHATMLGMTSLSINVAHGQAVTDFVCTLPGVDGNRLGVMGLSGGGTMTLWMALVDKRFRAVEIICYSDLWAYFGIRDLNYCGMQVTPGLYRLVDLPDLQGLLAPRPLLIGIGANDTCFRVDTSTECFRQLSRIYKAGGVADRLQLDFHGGEHSWGGNKSEAFFRENLGATWATSAGQV